MVRTQLVLTAFNNAPIIVQAYQHVSSLDYLIHEFGHRSPLILINTISKFKINQKILLLFSHNLLLIISCDNISYDFAVFTRDKIATMF